MKNPMRGILKTLNQAATAAFSDMRHPRVGLGWVLLNRTSINYASEVRADANPVVVACVNWIVRNFGDGTQVVEKWIEERQEWEQHQRDEVLDLLERPNNFYHGITLWEATIADLLMGDGGGGNAYWIKVRNRAGKPVQLWWAPASMINPVDNPQDSTVFIDHYDYSPGGGAPKPLRVEDVVHFRTGMDPANPRKGIGKMKSLLREIFTDDEAANMTASLLRNMGVPGVIISPKQGKLGPGVAEQIKETYKQKFSGDLKGEPLVMEGDTSITQFGFSPEQMQLRALRGIPEERIASTLGVPAAVVGLGSGLAQTKVGATLQQYREEGFESTIIPMYRSMAAELTHALVKDFKPIQTWRAAWDLSKVRVLQDDENKRAERLGKELDAGGITVAEYRRGLGLIVKPEHEIYLRRNGVTAVPAGLLPEAPGGTQALALRRDAERLEAALAAGLSEPGTNTQSILDAHYLLTAETTFATLGLQMPDEVGQQAIAEARWHGQSNYGGLADQIAREETQRAQRFALEAAKGVRA